MTSKQAKRMTIVGFIGPTALIFAGMILYAASRFVNAQLDDNLIERIINIVIFFIGFIGVLGIVPGIIIGIIGATNWPKQPKD